MAVTFITFAFITALYYLVVLLSLKFIKMTSPLLMLSYMTMTLIKILKITPYIVRKKISSPLIPWTSTILNLVVQNPRVLVQKVSSGSQAKWSSQKQLKWPRYSKVENSTVIWSHFLNVSVFFLIKNVCVPRTSHVKGSHVRTKFLPVPDNRTEVLVHLAFPQTSFGVRSSRIHFFRGGEMNARRTNP